MAEVVTNAHDLEAKIDALLGDPTQIAQIQQKATALVTAQKGASRQMVEIILDQLNARA